MQYLTMLFLVSGVETNLLIPPFVAMVVSFFTSMAGISGAFLLLPFQMSVLNYTSPSASGTNHVFNIIAVPSGIYRYIKEGRMAWPLTWIMIAGTLPGVFLGFYIRVLYLPDPRAFKLFVGLVLLYIGLRLIKDILGKAKPAKTRTLEAKFTASAKKAMAQKRKRIASGLPPEAVVRTISISLRKIEYDFWGEKFSFNPLVVFALAFLVGIIGGAYGIGGGAIIAPFCVSILHLPAYSIAGATLMGTLITSVAGSLFYSIPIVTNGASSMPDWPLGILFGIGGLIGMYLGARFQKFVPQRFIKLMLGMIIIFLAIRYIIQYF